MKEYQKIQTVYLRDPENKYKTLLEGTWSKPEFELLKNIDWMCTEKIDGANIRIMWDGKNVRFGGKTDNAQIPKILIETLQETFTNEKMKACFMYANNVCLYGEGYGKNIQKGGNYLPDRANFILFDLKVGEWWINRYAVEEIATEIQIPVVPVIGIWKLEEAIEFVKKGYTSTIAVNKNYMAEGLIMKPVIELFDRKGDRIISKIKYSDFAR